MGNSLIPGKSKWRWNIIIWPRRDEILRWYTQVKTSDVDEIDDHLYRYTRWQSFRHSTTILVTFHLTTCIDRPKLLKTNNFMLWWKNSQTTTWDLYIKPGKCWDQLPTSTSAGFLNHEWFVKMKLMFFFHDFVWGFFFGEKTAGSWWILWGIEPPGAVSSLAARCTNEVHLDLQTW